MLPGFSGWKFFGLVNATGLAITALAAAYPLARLRRGNGRRPRRAPSGDAPAPELFARRAFRRSLADKWFYFWAFAFGCAALWAVALSPFAGIPDPRIALSFLAIFPAFGLWLAASCWFLAPRLKDSGSLLAGSVGLALAAWCAIEFAARLALPRQGVVFFPVNQGRGGYGFYDAAPFIQLTLAGMALLGVAKQSAQRGEAWFRPNAEED